MLKRDTLIVSFTLIVLLAPGASAQQEVVFPDPQLASVIRQHLDIPDGQIITTADLEELRGVSARAMGIVDLSGLELAPNMSRVELPDNSIQDLTPLRGSASGSFFKLDFRFNRLVDLTPLAGMDIRVLWLGENWISDVAPLVGFPDLRELYLSENLLTDLTPLRDIASIGELRVNSNLLTNLDGLEQLRGIVRIRAQNNMITDISGLPDGAALRNLSLMDNRIEDLTGIEGIRSIVWLSLDRNRIRNLLPLQGISIDNLGLDDNEVASLAGLEAAYGGPKTFSASNNRITDITALSGWTNVYRLNLSNNSISDLTGLPQFANGPPPVSKSGYDYEGTGANIYLADNLITDLQVMVDNASIGEYDYIDLSRNPLSEKALTVDIPILEARGATVRYSDANSGEGEGEEFGEGTGEGEGDGSGDADGEAEPIVVVFPDLKLDSYVRRAISKPFDDILDSDLVGLTQLTAESSYILDLTGLEFATSLTSLRLEGNQISVITPLSTLVMLDRLTLSDNQIADIGPLAGLVNLRSLVMRNNLVADLSAVAELDDLATLILENNLVMDISAVANLANLSLLYLHGNQIIDITAVSRLINLRTLLLTGNQIADISAVSLLTNLTRLDLNDNQITRIDAVAGLTNLTTLGLTGNQIADISAVSSLTNLTRLDLSDNQIAQIDAISGLASLDTLFLENNQVSDIGPIVDNLALEDGESVFLRGNPLSQFALCVQIPALEARGVRVNFDGACSLEIDGEESGLEGEMASVDGDGEGMQEGGGALEGEGQPPHGAEDFYRVEELLIALELSGELLAPESLVAEIKSDLAAVREAFPDMAEIRHRPLWLPGNVLVKLSQEAAAAHIYGEFTEFYELNESLGLIEESQGFFNISLTFSSPYHPERLAETYLALEGVVDANPNTFEPVDGGDDVVVERPIYTFIMRYGDCPSGCLYSRTWVYSVVDGEVTLLQEFGDPVYDGYYGPPPNGDGERPPEGDSEGEGEPRVDGEGRSSEGDGEPQASGEGDPDGQTTILICSPPFDSTRGERGGLGDLITMLMLASILFRIRRKIRSVRLPIH